MCMYAPSSLFLVWMTKGRKKADKKYISSSSPQMSAACLVNIHVAIPSFTHAFFWCMEWNGKYQFNQTLSILKKVIWHWRQLSHVLPFWKTSWSRIFGFKLHSTVNFIIKLMWTKNGTFKHYMPKEKKVYKHLKHPIIWTSSFFYEVVQIKKPII